MGKNSPNLKANLSNKINLNFLLKFSLLSLVALISFAFAWTDLSVTMMNANEIANRTVSNTVPCGSQPHYGMYLNSTYGTKHYTISNGSFIEYDDGTAHLTGIATNVGNSSYQFDIDVVFSGRTHQAIEGAPKHNVCSSFNTSDWYYYTKTDGFLYGRDEYAGAIIKVQRAGSPMQLGVGANVTDAGNVFNASGWLNLTTIQHATLHRMNFHSGSNGQEGDFNFRLSGGNLNECNNVTHGGEIAAPVGVCSSNNDPLTIQSIELPSGGYGEMEYMWLRSTIGCTDSNPYAIPGAHEATYDPGPITQTTWFVRCSRRAGCSSWNYGESNCVRIDYFNDCGEPTPEGWFLTCEDGISSEILGEGIRCKEDFTFNIPNPSNVVSVVAEVVYKGNNASPTTLQIQTNNTTRNVSAQYTDPAKAFFFRTEFGPTSQIILSNIPNKCNAQSLILYVFRQEGTGTASTGRFVQKWLYHSTYCEVLDIATAPATRDVEITVPLSEITSDGRIAIVRATDVNNPTITTEKIIDDYTEGDALAITVLTLQNVPATSDEIEICVESPYGSSNHPDGQSLVYSGGIKADPECKSCDDSDLAANAEVISNYNGAQISCKDADDGRLQAVVSGGIPPFTYIWSNGASGQIINNVGPGTYAVTIADQFGCEATSTVTINEPSEVVANINITKDYNGQNISCKGADDAEVTASGNGGTPPYYYQWGANANFVNIPKIENLAPGTYNVLIADANGCIDETSITVTEPEELVGTATVSSDYNGQNISCAGAEDGKAKIEFQGGTAPYSIGWSNGSNSSEITNLGPGTYTVTVQDANDCEIMRSVTLTEPSPIVVELTVTTIYNGVNVSCFGAEDAAIATVALGGTGALSFEWSNGGTTANLSNVGVGTYTLTVTDINDCEIVKSIEVVGPTELQVQTDVISDYSGADISCSGANDGRAEVMITGALAPYTIAWSNGANTQIISDLSPGTYSVLVTDRNGCEKSASVTLEEPQPMTCDAQISSLYFEGVAISTIGGNDGSASVAVNGGTGQYVYQWDDSNFQTSQEATNLSAGTYSVLVSDQNGCTCTSQVTLEDPAKVGDKVFLDANANGLQDAGENGIEGVELTLTGTSNSGVSVTRTLTTDASGMYMFTGLLPGTYKITISTAANQTLTYLNQGGDSALDSDFDPATSMTTFFDLSSGEYNATLDAGIYEKASIGNYVWEDVNANGLQDAGENGIEGVTITLTGTTGNGTAVNETVSSDENGFYQFTELVPGDYKLTFGAATGYQATYTDQGDDTLDSDGDQLSGMTAFEELTSGENNDTYDQGFYKTGSIGNFVWTDINGNGLQDAGEPGIEGITVTLTGTTGNGTPVTLVTTTDENGAYSFENLIPGDYKLTFTTATDLVATYQNQGADSGIDSDVDPATGMTSFINIESGENDDSIDAGFYKSSAIGNFVWDDLNGNGVQDVGEPGIEGVQITIDGFTGNGLPYSETITSGPNGEYLFDGLVPGSYKLTFFKPTGYEYGYQDLGGDDERDSDIYPINGMTQPEILTSGETNLSYDAALYRPASIGNFVWEDLNGNGIQDAGEPGIGNIQVTLIGTDGSGFEVTQILTTNPDGSFIFENLKPGSYKLTFSPGTAYTLTAANLGGDDTLDSNADPINGMTSFENLLSGENNLTYDAGLYGPIKIGDYAWIDCNKDGLQSPDESPLAYAPVTLSGTDGLNNSVLLNTTTDVNGFYEFVNLKPGTYKVTFGFPALPAGLDFSSMDQGADDIDSDVNPQTAMTEFFVVISAQDNNDLDAGYIDAEGPVLSGIPSNVTVQCNDVPSVPELYVDITSTDNLDSDVQIIFSETSTQGMGDACSVHNYIITRTWTAADDCGNETSESQSIFVSDTSDPIISGVPANITVECTDVPAVASPLVSDNCDSGIELIFAEVKIDGPCEDSYSLVRTWTATDVCGNESSESQVITVQDIRAPELNGVPGDLTVECDNVPAAASPTITDNCDDEPQLVYAEVRINGSCEDSYELRRTWTAIDDCGNETVETQIIKVEDRTDPIFNGIPADVAVQCDEVPTALIYDATDNCDRDVDVQFSENIIGGTCENSYQIIRTWTATDNCGNQDIQTQTITVTDDEAPVLSGVPVDEVASCDDVPMAAMVTASDNCDDVVDVQFVENVIPSDCPNNYDLVRTWTATDNCGNQDVQSQTITVQDTEAPSLSAGPSDVTVECDNIPQASELIATDNCDENLEISFVEVREDGNCIDQYKLIRTWTVSDACGNESLETQEITVEDSTAPELTGIPSDVTVECDQIPAVAQPDAWDNCSNDLDISFVEITTDEICANGYTIVRTWTVADACGNETAESQKIYVQDTENPILSGVPGDLVVNCNAVPAIAEPTATDNCDENLEIGFIETTELGDCENNYVIYRTWTVVDACGNATAETQKIEVQDISAPELSGVPANVTVSCDAIPSMATVTATDDCSEDLEVDFNEIIQEGNCADNYVLVRTWTVADDCGNENSETQYITVQDLEDPVLSGIPNDITVHCGQVPAVAQPTANDNCSSNVDISFVEVVQPGDCQDNYTLVRTWTATDACGNQAQEQQEITVIDESAPSLEGVPTDVTVSCAEFSNLPSANVTASDDCDSNVNIAFSENITPGVCQDAYTVVRTWTATDACGNQDVQTQEITVQDETDPVLSGVPNDVTVECHLVPSIPMIGSDITAEDDCDTNVKITFYESFEAGNCAKEFVLIRSWTAEDNCGNQDYAEQKITVIDETAPELIGVPDNIEVSCDGVPDEAPEVEAEDNCSNNIEVFFSEEIVPGDCEGSYSIIRTWTAADECGNETSASQTITVGDDSAPELTAAPADVTVDCSEIPAPATITADDDCAGELEIGFVEVVMPGSCEDSYTLIRTWTANDGCGNENSVSQEITVEDIYAPEIIGVPENIFASCGSIDELEIPTVSVEDNCDSDPQLEYSENIEEGTCANSYTITRTWTATDACGNEAVKTQIVQVGDNSDPVLVGVPNDISIECGTIPSPATVTAEDDCDGDIVPSFIEISTPGDCTGSLTIKRTWTATDACGNQAIETQTITLSDFTAPTLSEMPADITVDAGNGEQVPAAIEVFATDQCDDTVDVIFNESSEPNGDCGLLITRTWSAKDDCGNEESYTQSITVLDDLAVNISPESSAICLGQTVQLSSGLSAGYDFDWSSAGGNIIGSGAEILFEAAMPGTYTITLEVTSATGCSGITTATVNVSSELIAEASSNSPVCYGEKLELYAAGGNSYEWSGPNGFVSSMQNPILENASTSMSGVYTVEISNGDCVQTIEIDVLVGSPITYDFSINEADCGSTGSIIIGATGGTGDFQFDWSDLTGNDNPQNRDDVLPGIYTVIITDSNGCSITSNDLEVGEDCGCDAQAGAINPENDIVCLESGSAELFAIPQGNATVPNGYTKVYVLTQGTSLTILDSSLVPEFTVDAIGNYTIHTLVYNPSTLDLGIIVPGITTGFDVNELLQQGGGDICASLDVSGASFDVTESEFYIADIDAEFCGEGNGYVALSPTDYTYNWNDGGTGAERNDLYAGTYIVQGISPEGCTTKMEIVVTETCECEEVLISDIVVIEASCGQSSGSATVVATGDVSDYTYDWTPNQGTPNGIGNGRSNLPSSIYTVVVTRVGQPECSTTVEVAVGNADGPEAESVHATPATCLMANGTVEILPTSNTYLWGFDGATGSTRTDLSAGSYSVIVYDGNVPPCADVITVIIESTSDLESSLEILSQPTCGDENGAVQINLNQGSGNYELTWSDGLVNSSLTRSNLEGGSYSVLIEDLDSGCTDELQFVLTNDVSQANVIITDIQNENCVGANNGFVEYTLSPFQGFAEPANVNIVDAQGSIFMNGNLPSGEYCIVVNDANGCLAGEACFTIEAAEELDVDVSILPKTCQEGGKVTLSVAGGTPEYQFDWADLSGNDNPANRANLEVGSYAVIITDAAGCSVSIETIVITDSCNDPCPAISIIPVLLEVDSEKQVCFELEDCMNGSNTTYSLISGIQSSMYGSWSLEADGCMTYSSGHLAGSKVDEICVVADDGTYSDTTCYVVSIYQVPLNNPTVDTMYFTTTVNIDYNDCLDLGEVGGAVSSSSIIAQSAVGGEMIVDGSCFSYQPYVNTTGVFIDSIEIVICNNLIEICDTTIAIATILPEISGCGDIFASNDSLELSALNCDAGATYCIEFADIDISQLQLFDNGNPIGTNIGSCGNFGGEINFAVGPHLLIAIDQATGCQDTLNVQINCGNCPVFYEGADTIVASDCDLGAEICLNFEIADLFDHTILVDGAEYIGSFDQCTADTSYQYVAFQLSNPNSFTLEEWIVDGQTFTLDLFTTTQQLVDSMNVWDPNGGWQSFGFVIVGGNEQSVYSDLIISSASQPTFSVPAQLIPDGTTIRLSEGLHTVEVLNNIDGCMEIFSIFVECDNPPFVIDTLLTINEGGLENFCFALENISTIENLCPDLSDGNSDYTVIGSTNCIEFSGDQLGSDGFCLVACDGAGICDSVNIEINVIPVTDTIVEVINLGFVDTLCLDTAIFQGALQPIVNICANPNNFNVDFNILDDIACIEYSADQIGQDTACLVLCDSLGFCDTTILILDVITPTIDTVDLAVQVGEVDTFCVAITELEGPIDTMYNICPELSGENAFVSLDELSGCVYYEGLAVGQDTACIVYCDAFGVCDTTVMLLDTQEDTPPIAVDDFATTTIGQPIVIAVLGNDTLNGDLNSLTILTQPANGNAFVNPDGSITYSPNLEFCGETDSFQYILSNMFGSDTATVFIFVECQELVIFSGFSPNGDEVNDVFTILGIEQFPNNEVCIFNRWGNRVFQEKGYTNARGWRGTFKGDHLPDGTYFYVIDDGEGRTFSGYLQIHR